MQITAPTQSAQVHYTVAVLDDRGRAVRRLKRKRNLILDQGLDGIAVRSWAASFTHAAVGTGTTPTKRDSGAITVSRTGSTLTASAGFFEAADVGRLFKFDTGQEVRITAFSSATAVTTATSGAIAAAEGTVWYVNQTGLATETKRSGTYSTDAGANGSSFLAGTWTHKRTFIFSAETGTVTYREIGWSHTATAGANLFGRDLLAGVGVTLVSGQQLRVVVQLSVSFSPGESSPYVNTITGWTQDGAHGIETASTVNLDFVQTNGVVNSDGALDPCGAGQAWTSTMSAAIRPISSSQLSDSGVIFSKGYVLAAYSSGTFFRDRTVTFSTTETNSSSIRSVGYGLNGANCAHRIVFNSNQAKTSAQTLSLTFRLSWGRVLNNA
jgi:hypothetical protein